MTLRPGLHAELRHTVTGADTATAVGSGEVPVLATPRLIALAEAATVAAVRAGLADDRTTVGTLVRFEHLRASPVGETVFVRADLSEVDGRRLRFAVMATNAQGAVLGRGEVVRADVDRARFLAQLPEVDRE